MITHTGGCHCGRVRFEVVAPAKLQVSECNCSMCSKAGYLHLIVPADRFRLLSGSDALTTYSFNTHTAKHLFCSVCGIKSFYVPRSHPDGFSVNARCLGPGTVEELSIKQLNGRDWEKHAFAALIAFFVTFCFSGASEARQSASTLHVGVLLVARSAEDEDVRQFRKGLQDAGYSEGRDLVIEWRSASGEYDRLPQLAAELVEKKPDAIVVEGTVAAQAAKRATSTIPIVMALVGDPVGSGLVTNLAHPGGNITGVGGTGMLDIWGKRLQLLKDTIPRLSRVAVLWDPDTPWHQKAAARLKVLAPLLSIQLTFLTVRAPEQTGPAISAAIAARAQALCVLPDAQLTIQRRTLLDLVSKARLPAIYNERRWADEGGLLSYGMSFADQWRRAAAYVDKILKGVRPSDLPIEQPTKFELVLNLKTAKAMGLAIPQSVLLQADNIIK